MMNFDSFGNKGSFTDLAFGDNLKIGKDFPAQRQRGSLLELAPPRPAGPHHHRPAQKPVRGANRQGIDDDLKGGLIRHMAVTLTVDKLGLDSQLISFGEKVHSARGLHGDSGRSRKFP